MLPKRLLAVLNREQTMAVLAYELAHIRRGDPAAVLVCGLTTRGWRSFECPSLIAAQNHGFFNTAFSPNGRYLAAGLTHPQVAVGIWDLRAENDTSE